MDESLLHYFWRNKLFATMPLVTTDGRELRILRTGVPHKDAGPDFKQAVVKVDDITWAGDVEIHVRASDWLRHGHQHDGKYGTIVLHVVYEEDIGLGLPCPTLELKRYIPPPLIAEYEHLSRSTELLPCRSSLPSVTSLQFSEWLSRLAAERYERKQQEVFDSLHTCHDSWHEAVFRRFVTNFGFRTNAAAFELLGRSLPYKYVLKHKDSRLQVYALVFGQAGMLEEECVDAGGRRNGRDDGHDGDGGGRRGHGRGLGRTSGTVCGGDGDGDSGGLENDEYYRMLQGEYRYLRYKYGLSPIPLRMWNLLRLRPQNFPCVRLAQLSECLYRIPDLMEQLLHCEDVASLSHISDFVPNEYWKTHRHFGRSSPRHSCQIGSQTVRLLVINTVVPVRLAYATFHGEDAMKEKAFSLLEQLDFESNVITRQYVATGFPNGSALYSQAILELHKNYCTPKQCLHCDIGCLILKRKSSEKQLFSAS